MVEGLYPINFKDALSLKKKNPEALLYSGGTDFMVRHAPCEKLLFLNGLQELKEITEENDTICIGAGATYIELIKNPLIPDVLKEAVKGIAAPAIRNAGTIGGNICNASPAGDTLPVLYAMEAKVLLVSEEVERVLPIEEFITGIRKLAIREDEILKQILLPKKTFHHTYYQKIGARKSQALSKLSFAGLLNTKNGKVEAIRIAFGSVGVTTVRVKVLEEQYTGISLRELKDKIEELVTAYNEYINPIDDQRSTAFYRKEVCLRLLRDFIISAKSVFENQ